MKNWILKEKIIKKDNKILMVKEANFENMKKAGANIWNGEVLCVSECNIEDNKVEIICRKSNYAHYLYGERVGCHKKIWM